MVRPVIIVGAGLGGLRCASLLASHGIASTVLEARDRIGGRVLSVTVPNRPELGRFDLGPTWFWPEFQPNITALVKRLGLATFEQHNAGAVLLDRSPGHPPQRYMMPPGASPRSMRLAGGIGSLIEAVAGTVSPETIQLGAQVTKLTRVADTITVTWTNRGGEEHRVEARHVILAIPPRLLVRRVSFSPSLPAPLTGAFAGTSTWLAGQGKAVAVYERPFWREQGLSGFVSSSVGPLGEIHDASPDKGPGALFGFFALPAEARHQLGESRILEMVTAQLVRLFGTEAEHPVSLLYKDWSTEPETAVEEDLNPLGYHPAYRRPTGFGAWADALSFAGTETASDQGGYLEGALLSADLAIGDIIRRHA